MSNFHIFGLEFEHIIAMFQIRKLEFVLLQSLVQKQKSLNLRPKIPYFGVFGWNLGKLFSCLKSVPSSLSICKISRKNKNA